MIYSADIQLIYSSYDANMIPQACWNFVASITNIWRIQQQNHYFSFDNMFLSQKLKKEGQILFKRITVWPLSLHG
jgi:hypothetical protein